MRKCGTCDELASSRGFGRLLPKFPQRLERGVRTQLSMDEVWFYVCKQPSQWGFYVLSRN